MIPILGNSFSSLLRYNPITIKSVTSSDKCDFKPVGSGQSDTCQMTSDSRKIGPSHPSKLNVKRSSELAILDKGPANMWPTALRTLSRERSRFGQSFPVAQNKATNP